MMASQSLEGGLDSGRIGVDQESCDIEMAMAKVDCQTIVLESCTIIGLPKLLHRIAWRRDQSSWTTSWHRGVLRMKS